jgi:hypothetical protein
MSPLDSSSSPFFEKYAMITLADPGLDDDRFISIELYGFSQVPNEGDILKVGKSAMVHMSSIEYMLL